MADKKKYVTWFLLAIFLLVLSNNVVPHNHAKCEGEPTVHSFAHEEKNRHEHHEHEGHHHLFNKYFGHFFNYLLDAYFYHGHQAENVLYHKSKPSTPVYFALIEDEYFEILLPDVKEISIGHSTDHKYSYFLLTSVSLRGPPSL